MQIVRTPSLYTEVKQYPGLEILLGTSEKIAKGGNEREEVEEEKMRQKQGGW
jgi:hypothetical protein